jgi:PhzF family phenazine biosynthesis protein
MHLRTFHVDAFTARPFAGNPAAVVPLDAWLPDATLQVIAAELNLSETAFFTPASPDATPTADFHLRWFTPLVEVDLCGHATLATAAVLTRELAFPGRALRFASQSGVLGVRVADDGRLVLDFPSRPPRPLTAAEATLAAALAAALGRPPREVLRSRDLVAIYDSPADVRALTPDMRALAAIEVHGAIATAPTSPTAPDADVDFVSRFFVPAQGVPEDPVTGSAHCTLTPLWAERLGKTRLRARQVSRRGGELDCTLLGDRVDLAGHAVVVGRGTLTLPPDSPSLTPARARD